MAKPIIKFKSGIELDRQQALEIIDQFVAQANKKFKNAFTFKANFDAKNASVLLSSLDGVYSTAVSLEKVLKQIGDDGKSFKIVGAELNRALTRDGVINVQKLDKSFDALKGRIADAFGDSNVTTFRSSISKLQGELDKIKAGKTNYNYVGSFTKGIEKANADLSSLLRMRDEFSGKVTGNESAFSFLPNDIQRKITDLNQAFQDGSHTAQWYVTQLNAIQPALTAAFSRQDILRDMRNEAMSFVSANAGTITASRELTDSWSHFFNLLNSNKGSIPELSNSLEENAKATLVAQQKAEAFAAARKLFLDNIDAFKNDPYASKIFLDLASTLDSASFSEQKFAQGLDGIQKYLDSTSASVQTFDDKVGNLIVRFMSADMLLRAVRKIPNEVRKIYTEVKDIDTSLANLQIVTGMSDNRLAQQFDVAAEAAQRTRASISDLIDSQTVYARLGFTADESAMLAESTTQLMKVGDVAIEDAQDAVTSVIKAYDKNVSDLSRIMDEMVMIGNNFPISASELAKAMGNAGSALSVAGNTVEESMAMLMAANSAVQDASKSSTGMRTIIARLRDNTTELNELGELDVEFKYEDILSAVGNAGVAVRDTNGDLRSSYAILSDLAEAWDDMSKAEQAALTKALAGTRQTNVFASLMNNFASARDALAQTSEAEGTMARSYAVYTQSVEGYASKLNATYQEFSKNFLTDDIIKRALSFADSALKVANALSKWNILLPGIVGALTGINARTGMNGKMYSPILGILGLGSSNTENVYANIAKIASGYRGPAKDIVDLLNKFKQANDAIEQSEIIISSARISPQFQNYLKNLKTDADRANASMRDLANEMTGGVWANIGSMLGSALINAGITVTLFWSIKLIDALIHRSERLIQKSEEAASAIHSISTELRDSIESISGVSNEYAKLAQGVDQLTGANKSLSTDDYERFVDLSNQMAERMPSLVRYYDENGNAILDLSGSYSQINEQIKERIQLLKDEQNLKIVDASYDLYQGISEQNKSNQETIQNLETVRKFLQQNNNHSILPDELENAYAGVFERLEQLGIDALQEVVDDNNNVVAYRIELDESAMQDAMTLIDNASAAEEKKISDRWKGMTESLSAYAQMTMDNMLITDGTKRGAIMNAVATIDIQALKDDGTVTSMADLQNWISANIIAPLSELDETQFIGYLRLQTMLNNGECSVNEFEEAVRVFVEALDLPAESRKAIYLSLGLDENGNALTSADKIKDRLSNLTGSSFGVVGQLVGSLDTDEVDEFAQYCEDVVNETGKRSIGELYNDYLDFKNKVEGHPTEIKYNGNAKSLESQLSDLQRIDKEFTENNYIALSSLDEIIDTYPELTQAVMDYKAGLISANNLIYQQKQAYIDDAVEFANAEFQKQIMAGATADQAANAWYNALSSLGVSYNANGNNFASMLTGIVGSNSDAVQIFVDQWDRAFSSIGSTMSRLINDTRTRMQEITSAMQESRYETRTIKVAEGKYKTVKTWVDVDLSAQRAEYNELSARLNDLIRMQQAVNSFSYTAPSSASVRYGGGSGGSSSGGGGGSGASASSESEFERLSKALQSEAEWYEYQAEQFVKTMNTRDAIGSWKQAVSVYKELSDNAQRELNRLAAAGLGFGDDDYDSVVQDLKTASDAIEKIFANMLDSITDQYEDYADILDGLGLFGPENGYRLNLIKRELEQIDDAYAHSLLATEDYVKRKADVIEKYYDAYMDYIDAVADAVDKSIETEKKALESQRDGLAKTKEQYDTVIDVLTDMIEKRIDSLDEENDELERQQRLEQALLDLERARASHTKRIYREGEGFVWEADANAVRDAQKAYDDLKKEYADDEVVNSLNKVKDALKDIQNAYQTAKNNQLVADLFGDNWDVSLTEMLDKLVAGGDESDVVLQRMLADIASYEAEYSRINRDLDEDAEGSVANQITALENLADAWSDFADNINDESSQYEGLLEYIKEFESANYDERMKMLEEFSKNSVEQLEAIRKKAGDVVDAFDVVKNDQNISDIIGMTGQQEQQQQQGGQSSSGTTQTSTKWDNLPSLGNVYYGSSSSAIRQLQEALIAAGYGSYMSGYGADGQFGPKTLAAVKAFQRTSGLSVDGIAGINTLTALRKKLRGYSAGGVIDYTGLAMVHGGTHPEIALNNQDVAKIYQYIHETPNLISDLVNNRLPRSASIGRGNAGGRVINVTVGDLYEVNDAAELAHDIEMRLPNLLEQKLFT